MNGTLQQVEKLLKALRESVLDLTDRLQELEDNDTIGTIIEMLNGDPDEFADFFSNPQNERTRSFLSKVL